MTNERSNEKDRRDAKPSRVRPLLWVLFVAAVVIAFTWGKGSNARHVTYTELLQLVADGKVQDATIHATRIDAHLRPDGGAVTTERLPGVDESGLVKELRDHGVVVVGDPSVRSPWMDVAIAVVPLLAIGAFFFVSLSRAMVRGGPLAAATQKSIPEATSKVTVTFADVAGIDEAKAELMEVVDFLRAPAKYAALGARTPKGVLLLGPPGTGKTLLARAIAGEAGVPFFAITGSQFVELFVGMGAARVRTLFEKAREKAPCIVFIDEIDAIGKSRSSVAITSANDEREQTLNQLLAEMDGFDASTGVILIAATNRPETLDRALVRPGRFDRQILVDRPDLNGRRAILAVHAKRLVMDASVDLDLVARRTPGAVGADLANVVNEAALAAARRNAKAVGAKDFDEALDRIQLGLKKHGRVMTSEEKRRVAHHEAGHAVVALSVSHSDPVHRITIIPRSIGALGATLQLPTEDRYLVTRAELRDRICILMGGRAAEAVACGDVSTGAQNDLEVATETARQMVCRFGMNDAVGPQIVGSVESTRAATLLGLDERRTSERTATMVDAEVRRILDEESTRAMSFVSNRRALLDRLVAGLIEHETLERAEIDALVQDPRSREAAE